MRIGRRGRYQWHCWKGDNVVPKAAITERRPAFDRSDHISWKMRVVLPEEARRVVWALPGVIMRQWRVSPRVLSGDSRLGDRTSTNDGHRAAEETHS
jgi:hypothetical protein